MSEKEKHIDWMNEQDAARMREAKQHDFAGEEVEMEEEMTREAMGISEEEEIASSSTLRESQSEEGELEEELSENPTEEAPEEEWQGPDVSVAELLDSETEEISLEGLNDLADDLDEEESEDIDVTFLDDVLDDD